jgi:hypothetical protein
MPQFNTSPKAVDFTAKRGSASPILGSLLRAPLHKMIRTMKLVPLLTLLRMSGSAPGFFGRARLGKKAVDCSFEWVRIGLIG